MITNWHIKKLGEVTAYFNDGNWIESDDQSNIGIRLVQTGNVGLGYFIDKEEKMRFITEETFKRLRCAEIFEGDILISRLPDPVGRSCLLPKLETRAITAVDCTIARFPTKLLAKYFLYYSLTNTYFNEIKRYLTGSSRVRVSKSNLAKANIILPPDFIQKKIVERLDAIRKAQELCSQQIQKTEELYRAIIYNDLLSGKFHTVRLEEVTKPQVTVDPTKTPEEEYNYVDISSIDSENLAVDLDSVKRFKGKDAPSRARKKISTGDILFSTVRPSLKRIAKVEFPTYNSLASTGFTVLSPDNNRINPSYLGSITCSGIVTDQVLPFIRGAAYPAVSDKDVLSAEIPYPERKRQDEIVKKLEAMQNYKKLLLRQKELLKELFDSVLHKSIKGEMD